MLKAHLEAVETSLLAQSRIPANAGHSLHKGTPRETFIRKFLEGHLSEKIAIGTGEIIDCNSEPNPPPTAQRHQYDIVLYKRDYPRLDIGGGISAFLAESVVATIEVKSNLTQEELLTSVRAARASKGLVQNVVTSFTTGHQPASILNYVVAYGGPAKMTTVHGWLAPIYRQLGITASPLPMGTERNKTSSHSLDGVFVLGKGSLTFDNVPFSFIRDEHRVQLPNSVWQIVDSSNGSLLYLFLLLTTAISGVSASWLNPLPYLKKVRQEDIVFGP